ncbi:MAG: response regulator [Longimicrobiales bacterium]
MSTPIRVLIADDHEVVREGLQLILAGEPDDILVVGRATDGHHAVALAVELRPDVILMDLVMPGLSGIDAIRNIRAAGVDSRIVVLTTFVEEEQVREAIVAGAIGYLLKDVARAELVQAIRAAAQGRPTLHAEAQQQLMRQIVPPDASTPFDALTSRELDVLRLIASGRSNKAIAKDLGLTLGTVKGHVSSLLEKLGVHDRTQAALLAVRHGLDS